MKNLADEDALLSATPGLDLRWLAAVVSLHVAAVVWAAVAMQPDRIEKTVVMSVQLLPMAAPVVPTPRKPQPPRPTPPKPKAPEPVLTRVKTTEAVKAAPLPEPSPVPEAPRPEPRLETRPEPVLSQPLYQIGTASNPAPEYPRASRDLRETGRVVLRVLVAADGRPREVEIHQGSGFWRLDEAARFTVARRWKFTPARRGDEAIEAWVRVGINFKLDDAE